MNESKDNTEEALDSSDLLCLSGFTVHKPLSLEEWQSIKENTTCSICENKGYYMGFKNDWGSEMRRYKCGCAYKDAHITGLYPIRF